MMLFGYGNFELHNKPFEKINGIILLNVRHKSDTFVKYTRHICELKPCMGYGIPINCNNEKFKGKFKDPSGPAPRGARLAVFLKTPGECYVLVCHHFTRDLVFPGGGADINEDPKDTAIRETLEETGYQITDKTSLRVVNALAFPYHMSMYEDTFEHNAVNLLFACIVQADTLPTNLYPTEKEDDILGSKFIKYNDILTQDNVTIVSLPVAVNKGIKDNVKKAFEVVNK